MTVFRNGARILGPGERGARIVDDGPLILLNADASPLSFVRPRSECCRIWSDVPDPIECLVTGPAVPAGGVIRWEAHGVVVLSRPSLDA